MKKMKRTSRNLVSAFFICLIAILIFGGIPLACEKIFSRIQTFIFLTLLALAVSLGITAFLKKVLASFQRSILILPDGLIKETEDKLPQDAFDFLCRTLVGKMEEVSDLTIDRFLQHLLIKNDHTRVIENLDQHIKDILHNQDFGYRWPYFCLIYIRLEDYGSYILKDCNGHIFFTDFRRMYGIVSHAFHDALNKQYIAHGTEWKNSCVFLVNLPEPEDIASEKAERTACIDLQMDEDLLHFYEAAVDNICEICENVVDRIKNEFNLTLETAVSIPFLDVTDTYNVYNWLETAKEYDAFVYGPKAVFGPQEYETHVKPSHIASSVTEKTYYSALLAEDFNTAEQTLYEIERYALSHNGYDVSSLKSAVIYCLNAAENFALSNNFVSDEISAPDWQRDIQGAETQEQLEAAIHNFFLYLTDRLTKRQDECSHTVRKIMEFLDENITCSGLSVSMLSDSLSLSPSYISRIFKRETGRNIPDYIHEKRVKLAKELLTTTDISINDIAIQVGYSTSWTMNRVFRQITHMTPGMWRMKMRSDQKGELTS